MYSKKVNHSRKGFTLVELLVVISIIALLMSIMMPALSRVRVQAQSIACGSNLRQLGLAWVLYANDNDGWFPVGVHWSKGLAWWAKGHGIAGYLPSESAWQDEDAEKKNVYKGWYCPVHVKDAIRNEQAVSYQFNFNMGFERCAKMSSLKRTAENPILFDFWDNSPKLGSTGRPLYIGNYCSRPTDPPKLETDYSAWYFMDGMLGAHSKGVDSKDSNFLFADAHVEKVKTKDTQEDYANAFSWEVPSSAVKVVENRPRW